MEWTSSCVRPCSAGFQEQKCQLHFWCSSVALPHWQLHREQSHGSSFFLMYYIMHLSSSVAKWQKLYRISTDGMEHSVQNCHLAPGFLLLPQTFQYLTFHRVYQSKLSPNCSNDLLVKSKLLAKLQALITSTDSNHKKTSTFKAAISYSMSIPGTPWSTHATSLSPSSSWPIPALGILVKMTILRTVSWLSLGSNSTQF